MGTTGATDEEEAELTGALLVGSAEDVEEGEVELDTLLGREESEPPELLEHAVITTAAPIQQQSFKAFNKDLIEKAEFILHSIQKISLFRSEVLMSRLMT